MLGEHEPIPEVPVYGLLIAAVRSRQSLATRQERTERHDVTESRRNK